MGTESHALSLGQHRASCDQWHLDSSYTSSPASTRVMVGCISVGAAPGECGICGLDHRVEKHSIGIFLLLVSVVLSGFRCSQEGLLVFTGVPVRGGGHA